MHEQEKQKKVRNKKSDDTDQTSNWHFGVFWLHLQLICLYNIHVPLYLVIIYVLKIAFTGISVCLNNSRLISALLQT